MGEDGRQVDRGVVILDGPICGGEDDQPWTNWLSGRRRA
jgi:hypothetical protein